jgi:hypothetical protein
MTAIVLATANLVSLDVALATSDPSSIKIGEGQQIVSADVVKG